MPGYEVARSAVKNTALFDKYQCPNCSHLLRRAVQPLCGHWLCESCADELLVSSSPKCPRPDCQEDLQADPEEGAEYFPDRFVRREIKGLIVSCPHRQEGCNWEDRLGSLEGHLKTCEFISKTCPDCGIILTLDQMESHKLACPKALRKCPLVEFGCTTTKLMVMDDLKKHVADHGVEHLCQIAEVLALVMRKHATQITSVYKSDSDDEKNATGQSFGGRFGDDNEKDCVSTIKIKSKGSQDFGGHFGDDTERDCAGTIKSKGSQLSQDTKAKFRAVVGDSSRVVTDDGMGYSADMRQVSLTHLSKIKVEMEERLTGELRRKDEEIGVLRNTITKMEKSMRSKHAEFEDRDFRLSLIENSNYDGTTIWKIPQFSQRMSDAQTGKYTSIFSLPFYTGRYGYKMCLRLYILGDGIGKNSHMSLFFVIMKGEFDNVLQWPFTHKVTFKLINQTGGRDIIDTFQPDPMSSSFRKPKSDMNIASGCPRFVSHTELKSGGFIVDDTVFIKCSVDCNTIKHP